MAAMTVAATAHHSIAVFDQAHPIELVGTVQEFRFTSPHAFIRLEVLDRESHKVVWNLEGDSPNSLAWGGWSFNTLKPGDELRLTILSIAQRRPGRRLASGQIQIQERLADRRHALGGSSAPSIDPPSPSPRRRDQIS